MEADPRTQKENEGVGKVKMELKAPFPWFGGKSAVADIVWQRFGQVRNYVEPFAGSLAVLLGRPATFEGTETVNDLDGYICNFWRALQADPDAVAHHADWPVNECDLHARHAWLVGRKDDMTRSLEGDPCYYDAQIAGWWVWGISCWIGSGWCTGKGPWRVVDGKLVRTEGNAGQGVNRKLPHLGNAGQGVNRKLPHLGDAGRGVKRQLPHLGDAGRGVNRQAETGLQGYLQALADRLRRVRVCCGDWSRVCGPSVTTHNGLTAVFLDPPYADTAGRDPRLYRIDSLQVAHAVRDWALANGDNPDLRICLAGYEGEHEMPDTWECVPWTAQGGHGNQGKNRGEDENRHRERLWFSPHCLDPRDERLTIPLFAHLE